MDLARKLELAAMAVVSISHHDDEDAAVRHAFLDQLATVIKTERDAIDARVGARITEALSAALARV
jgi:hypothetical protein